MTRLLLFVLVTAGLGWALQLGFLQMVPASLPTPHGLLLAVAALGGRGRPLLAMGLGFFWGLGLDVLGSTAFGTQAWLLALVGYGAGRLSCELDVDKPFAQAFLGAGASLVFGLGVMVLGRLFPPVAGGTPGLGILALGVILNALAAPAVFWALARWTFLWADAGGRRDA